MRRKKQENLKKSATLCYGLVREKGCKKWKKEGKKEGFCKKGTQKKVFGGTGRGPATKGEIRGKQVIVFWRAGKNRAWKNSGRKVLAKRPSRKKPSWIGGWILETGVEGTKKT